jgi:hypothetical protein
MEKVSKEQIIKNTWFSHLVLDSDREPLDKLSGKYSEHEDHVEVELKINGVPLRVEDFNKVLDEWSDRIGDLCKEQLDYLNTEEAVVTKAEQLITEKLDNIHQILYDVENNLWKLRS